MKRLILACVLTSLVVLSAQAREWTFVNGSKTEAEFLGLQGNKVILKFQDGRTATVVLENLSAADQAFARDPANATNVLEEKVPVGPVQVDNSGKDRFTAAIVQDPENPSKYYARGMYYANRGKNEEAMLDFKKVAELADADKNEKAKALAYNGMGKVYVAEKQFAKAHDSFSKAIDTDETLAAAYKSRADNLYDYYKNSQEGQDAFDKDRAAYRKKRDGIDKRYLQNTPWQPPYSTTDESIFNTTVRNMQNVDYALARRYDHVGWDGDDYGHGGYGVGGGGGGVGVGGVGVVGPQVAVGGAVIGPGLAVYPPVAVKGEVIELVANPSELAKGMPVKVGPGAPKLKKGEEPTPEMLQAIKSVDFYRDIDGDGALNPATDQYLTTDTDGSDGYSAKIATGADQYTLGTHNYFAVPKGDGTNGPLDATAIGALTLQENLLKAAAESEDNIAKQLGTAATGGGLSAESADLISREQSDIQRILTDVERKVKDSAPQVAEQLSQARKTAGSALGDLRKAKSNPGIASQAPAGSAQTNAKSTADQIKEAAKQLAAITGSDKPEGEEGAAGPANPAAEGPVDPYAPGAPAEPPPGPANPGTAAVAAGTLNPPPGAKPGAPGTGAAGGDKGDGPDVVINNYDRDGDGDVDDDDLVINNFDDDRDGALDRAVGFVDDRDYDRALVEYDRVLGGRPYDIDALRGRAQTHLESGGYEYAIRDYDRLIGLAPRNADFYYNRGCAHLAADELAAADSDFSMSIQLDELQKLGNLAYNNRGITRARQGHFDEALADFDKAILINRNDALAYRNRALAYKRLGKMEEAQADLVRFNDLNVVVEK